MKLTKLIFALMCGICLGGLWSCEDTRGEYLDEFDTMIYFRNGGEQSITLYSVGNNAKYAIPVCKGGSVLDATATARIVAMDQAQLDIYNMVNETNYVQMPGDCFAFQTETEFTFASSDTYKVAVVELVTDKIREQQQANPDAAFVLALQVYSAEKVSSDINRLILLPEVEVPVVSFSINGVSAYTYTPDSEQVNTHTTSLTLNMPSSTVEWDFDCTIAPLGQAWVDAYNESTGAEYNLLPASQYTLPEKIHFTEGNNTANFDVTVDRDGFAPFEYFALPLQLTSCSKKELTIDEEAVLLMVFRLEPSIETIALTADMISSPYTHTGDGGGIPALIDGNIETFWHSWYDDSYTGDAVYGFYIDIALPSPLNVVKFSYTVRHNNNNGYPTKIRIGVSNDGENWTMIGEANANNYEVPTATREWGVLPTFYSNDSFTYIRFGIAESNPTGAGGDLTDQSGSQGRSTALGELVLEGCTL